MGFRVQKPAALNSIMTLYRVRTREQKPVLQEPMLSERLVRVESLALGTGPVETSVQEKFHTKLQPGPIGMLEFNAEV